MIIIITIIIIIIVAFTEHIKIIDIIVWGIWNRLSFEMDVWA